MAIGSTSRQNSFGIEGEKCDSWDPFVTLGITNPDTRSFTCVGYAPSQRRRCQNRIARCNANAAFTIIGTLPQLSPSSSKIGHVLLEIASLCLCRAYHQNQAESVAARWQKEISSLKLKNIRSKSWRVYEDLDSSNSVPVSIEKKTSSQTRQPLGERSGENAWRPKNNGQYSTFYEQQGSEKERNEQKRREKYKEEDNDKERKVKEEEKGEQERQEREIQEQERREEERLKRQMKEQARKEQEGKEKEQRDRAAQNERIRLAAKKKREEQERQRQELIAKEKKEWEQSWVTFTSRWTAFKATKDKIATKESIPWPVKSGRYADLTASQVRMFFLNACPHADSPARMYNFLKVECLKWHPDKAPIWLPGFAIGMAEREVLLMICRVVLELKEEANKKR